MKNLYTRLHPGLLLVLFLVMGYQKEADAQTQKPNIIFILGDDIGYKTLTCNGGSSFSTPNLDAMAQQGMNFSECHATPTCSPSRFELLTGKYNFRNYTKWAVMDTGQKTIANMLKDAGYKTACYGKWQLDGGDIAAHAFGFDNYCLYNVFEQTLDQKGSKYKSPFLYSNGHYIADSLCLNKYSEDILGDSLLKFIEDNKSTPFFVYYPMILAHEPFQPTPDDSAFSSWNSATASDTSYYASMIHYMDKKVGAIIDKVNSLGIQNNTIIIYSGDNGTPRQISEYVDDDSLITGDKGKTTEAGIHVPLIIYWPETVTPNSVNNDLIDFTDFLPTLAGIAHFPVPTAYGPLDGVSFYPRLINQTGTPRDWIFYHYDMRPGTSQLKRWAQTKDYKLYDTSFYQTQRRFYNFIKDKNENSPISDSLLTPDETLIKQQLLEVINSYVAQAAPIFTSSVLSSVTDSSALIKDSIKINGGSTIITSGAVWSTKPTPVISSSPHTSDGKILGSFQTSIKNLLSNTMYYVRVYATNGYSTTYGNEIKFKTLVSSPVSTPATSIDSTRFTANWISVTGATSYRLDVSSSPTFTKTSPVRLIEGFDSAVIPPSGWTFSTNIKANNFSFGTQAPSLEFTANKDQIITAQLTGPATELKFWIKGLNTKKADALVVEGFDGYNWTIISKITNLPSAGAVKTFNATTRIQLSPIFIQFRFTYTKFQGTLAFDDVSIRYNNIVPSFIQGYNNLTVTGTSQIVTGLTALTNYYYRVRAKTYASSSGNSNVITATTCSRASITNISASNLSCSSSNNGSIALTVTGGLAPLAYSWTGPNSFQSSDKDLNSLTAGSYHLTVTSNGGCAVDTGVIITEPAALTATVNIDAPITCIGGTTTLTVIAQGGTGNYHYTLSNGTNIVGPQDDNHFTVAAGSYIITVADDNGCSFTTDAVQVDDGSNACNAIASANNNRNEADLKVVIKNKGFNIQVFPNPAFTEFTLTVQNNTDKKLEISVMDMYGKKVFHATGGINNTYKFGKEFPSGVYFVKIIQGKEIQAFKLIKEK